MSGKAKAFLDKTGLGKTLRGIGTTLVSNIPGVGPGIANAIRQLPAAAKPIPGSDGERTLVKNLKKIEDTTGVLPADTTVQAMANAAIDADMSDPRFPVSGLTDGQIQAQNQRGGATRKDGVPGSGTKPEKVTADSVMSAIKAGLPLVVGIFVILIVAMRVPMVKKFVMGGASYVRRSYSGYQQRRSARRSKR